MVPDLFGEFAKRGRARPEALIVVAAARHERKEAETFRRLWQAAVPRAEFAGLSVDVAGRGEDFAKRLADAATRRMLPLRRTILLGRGFNGRAVLDLLLQGRLCAAGVLAIDVALWPPPHSRSQSEAIVRMVQHRRPDDPHSALYFALLDEIRRAAPDLRYALLEAPRATTAAATLRAGAGYLVELVAHASRLPSKLETSP